MSTEEKRLYQEITVKGNTRPDYGLGSKTYKGFSTVDPDQSGFNLYDFSIIKQDKFNSVAILFAKTQPTGPAPTIITSALNIYISSFVGKNDDVKGNFKGFIILFTASDI